MVKIKVVIPKS